MTSTRSLKDKEKRKIYETYDTTLFDLYEYVLKLLKFKSKIIYKEKYMDVKYLCELKTII